MTSFTKPQVHNIATSSEKDWATATGKMYKKFGEVWPCGFGVKRADWQTDKQTNRYNHNTLHSSQTRSK